MAGKKGRSGRRTKWDEEQRKRVLQQAWILTAQFFNNPDIPVLDKQKIAIQMVVKDITQTSRLEGDALSKVIIAYSGAVNQPSDRLISNQKLASPCPATDSNAT